ncbi:MAG: 2-phospho-L-lactate guanylyltransferase [Candidatus Hodarchaeales archaeon]
MKDFTKTKTRLKASLSDEKSDTIERLVEVIFFQTIEVLNNAGLTFGIVSPSLKIIASCAKKGAEFTFRDKGDDLNSGLTQAINPLPKNQPLFILMPDLPFLTKSSLIDLLGKTPNNDVLIVPSITGKNDYTGTSMLYLRSPTLLSFEFGVNSHEKYQKAAQERNLQYELVNSDPYARDIDTLRDLKYLMDRIEEIHNTKLYSDLLLNLI